ISARIVGQAGHIAPATVLIGDAVGHHASLDAGFTTHLAALHIAVMHLAPAIPAQFAAQHGAGDGAGHGAHAPAVTDAVADHRAHRAADQGGGRAVRSAAHLAFTLVPAMFHRHAEAHAFDDGFDVHHAGPRAVVVAVVAIIVVASASLRRRRRTE